MAFRGTTNKLKLTTNLTLYEPYNNYWTKLSRVEHKRKKKIKIKFEKRDFKHSK